MFGTFDVEKIVYVPPAETWGIASKINHSNCLAIRQMLQTKHSKFTIFKHKIPSGRYEIVFFANSFCFFQSNRSFSVCDTICFHLHSLWSSFKCCCYFLHHSNGVIVFKYKALLKCFYFSFQFIQKIQHVFSATVIQLSYNSKWKKVFFAFSRPNFSKRTKTEPIQFFKHQKIDIFMLLFYQ